MKEQYQIDYKTILFKAIVKLYLNKLFYGLEFLILSDNDIRELPHSSKCILLLLLLSLKIMELVQKNSYFDLIKSFLVWSFTLTVCLLVVGFPVGALVVTIGILATIILQTVIPASAVLVVTGSIFALNIGVVLLGAAILAFKGIYPEQVSWLSWLHGQNKLAHTPVYASCPLTCQFEINV